MTRPPTKRQITLLGMDIDVMSESEVVGFVISEIQAGRGGWVVTPNSDHLRQFKGSSEIRRLVSGASLAVADGMPLIWASRIQGTPLPERVAGSNLIWSLSEAAAHNGMSVFLLGGDPGVAERASTRLRDRFSQLIVAGSYCPPVGFEKDDREAARIRAALHASSPRVVFVGLGFPKQERLISQLRAEFPDVWFLGIGIAFSFVSGEIDRAPRWMHAVGLEWMHRLINEPDRLFGRYVRHGIPFVLALLVRSAVLRVRLRTRRTAS